VLCDVEGDCRKPNRQPRCLIEIPRGHSQNAERVVSKWVVKEGEPPELPDSAVSNFPDLAYRGSLVHSEI